MKKIIFSSGALMLTLLFVYCSKSDISQELKTETAAQMAADRVPCVLNIQPANVTLFTFCGVSNNDTPCVQCGAGNTSAGVANLFGPGQVTVEAPGFFSVTSSNQSALNINGGQPVPINAGQCIRFFVDANCNVTPVK